MTTQLSDAVRSANTGLDAIKRAPIVENDTGIKCLRIQDVSQSKQYADWGFCEVTDNNFTRFQLQHGDIIVARTGGSIGVNKFISEKVQSVFNNGLIRLRINTDKFLPKFIYYTLRIPAYYDHIDSIAFGTSAQPNMKIKDLLRYEFQACNLKQQESIVSVMSALDDKIELNRRMNATLEAMARALFKSYFVDFDPVRAKLDGRKPEGMDKATAALFPDAFQESPIGPVPKGWTIQPVGEVVDCVGGGTPSTAEPKYWEGGTHHWTTPKDFSSLHAPVLLDTDRKLTDAGIAKISSGLLPAGTLLLSSRAPVGYLAIAAMPVAINQGFIALKCNDCASNFFMLNWCQTNMAEIESRATGTTFAEISKQNFRPICVVLPPKELVASFTSKVAPLYAQITANLLQSRTLATLRDTLLPKLLSGELSVASIPKVKA
jgi:type I restriction enzyme S subunit